MVSAALAAGNAVVYKPSEQTTAIGRVLYDALIEAGVPKDVLHFLPGEGSVIGAHMVAHNDVAGIAFTGSKEVGLRIFETAGKTPLGQPQTKKCVIEMGGKNAIIIDNDADLDEAVPAVMYSAFAFQGQKCSAASRVIVVGSHYEAFIARIQDMVNELRVGPADNPFFDVNAVIDLPSYDKINKIITAGKKDCKLVAQAQVPEGGFFVPPTVFADIPQDHPLTQEEIFGPVLCVYRAKTFDEAVKMALGTPFALTGALFSRNPKTIAVAKDKFRVGNLYINRGCTGAMVGRQPFGGGKMSGVGTKAGGPDYLLNFLEARVITENTMRRGFAPKDKN
jgi:RHH-type proline utilization regulon transcriptional repressor/proline dehydrogenase/delta 1-pyrroline-5-carboxylate dehydrogenase